VLDIFRQFAVIATSSFLLIAAQRVDANTPQDSVVQGMKDASAETGFKNVLRKANVTLNFESAKTTTEFGIVPVNQHWAQSLKEDGKAIVGAIYTQRDLTKIDLKRGFYVVEAEKKLDGSVQWLLLKSDGTTAAGPIKVQIEKVLLDVGVPKALSEGSPRRCCFEDDHVRHCGECD
jgi:hypothetical protein